jgi:transmembrane 9 superfamily member 2/4
VTDARRTGGGLQEGDAVELEVNALSSPNSVVPFDYYHKNLNFCGPDKPKPSGGSLGAILFGDRKYDSLMQLYMLRNTTCNVLCTRENSAAQTNFVIARVQERYLINWCVFVCVCPCASLSLRVR